MPCPTKNLWAGGRRPVGIQTCILFKLVLLIIIIADRVLRIADCEKWKCTEAGEQKLVQDNTPGTIPPSLPAGRVLGGLMNGNTQTPLTRCFRCWVHGKLRNPFNPLARLFIQFASMINGGYTRYDV